MCFLDITLRFDTTRLADALRLIIQRRNFRQIIATHKELNTSHTKTILTGNQTTKKIPATAGIRQPDSHSRILFNLIMDEKINEVKTAGKRY